MCEVHPARVEHKAFNCAFTVLDQPEITAHTLSQSLLCFIYLNIILRNITAGNFLYIKPATVICGAPVNDATPCSQVLSLQQPSVQGEVLHEGCLAVRRSVYVPVVTNRQQRLEGVLHHAGHGDGNQTVRLVIFKDVAPLAMQ